MKTTLLSLAFAAFAAFAVHAETTTTSTTTTTTGNGTITEYTPGSTFTVKEESGPVHYRYGKKVEYYHGGKVLSEEDVKTRVKVGGKVHVHYDRDGDARVIHRIDVDD